MADCREQAVSNDFFDFIISYVDTPFITVTSDCIQRIDEDYDIFYYAREGLPDLNVAGYSYEVIPKCFGLLDQTALEASGILRMQNQPALRLRGNGVLVGFIDTGIDYTNPLFRFSDGSTRILSIWDQELQSGTPPQGILYGSVYRREEIDRALLSDNPYELVPSRDENGHGTFLAGVAAGGEDVRADFIGAVPEASIAVVKLKEAKQYLKDFYFIPDGVPVYQENDIMLAVSYLNGLAMIYDMPLVICLGVGSSMGNHGRTGAVSTYLNYICGRRKRCVVAAAGNEANARRHFQGELSAGMNYEDVQINVEQDMRGFYVELWAKAPELYAVAVISPTGEQIPRVPVRAGASLEFRFVFEQTTVSVDCWSEPRETASQLVYLRFKEPKQGIWIVRVFPQNVITGNYHMWLPMQQMTDGEVFFLRSNPDMTITDPGSATQVITPGGYNAANEALYLNSGRGYTIDGEVKPDFVAPAVEVYGPGLRQNYVTYTGTSAAAAVTAGACAQIMQWGFVDLNEPRLSNAGIKNMLIRGADRDNERSYPNREWGYGTLDVYQAFLNLRG
uniref:S8 family peptidase n=1 Tax=Roseburia sp. TaxID=2049040 RepID=UPI003FF03A16